MVTSTAFLLPLIYLFLTVSSFENHECETICTNYYEQNEFKQGNVTCVWRHDGSAFYKDRCSLECDSQVHPPHNFKVAKDQKACFCDMCMHGQYFSYFCTKYVHGTDTGLKSRDDCHLVCEGKAKYRWVFCKGV